MSDDAYLEGIKTQYVFHCHDRSGSAEILVDVGISWSDFLSDLRQEFGRNVNFTYRRDEEEVEVKNERDFDEFCGYCDEEQVASMDIYIKDKPMSELEVAQRSFSSPRDILGASVQKDNLYALRPPTRHVRPSTAGARRPNVNGKSIANPSKRAAWEKQGGGGGGGGGGSSPKPKRQARIADERLDKETLQHKVNELQRQINVLVDEKTRLHADYARLQQDFNKVLRENEELFRAKAGSAAVKGGASSHLVHNMKKRIKELEGLVSSKEEEMKKLKMDTRVTRLTELEVERDAFLQEVRRLQRENRKVTSDMQKIQMGFSANNEEHTMNYKELYRMYQIVVKDNNEMKKRAETVEAKSSELRESFQIAQRANEKLRKELHAAKASLRKAAAEGGSSEGLRSTAQQRKGKEEALEKRVKELLANQKRLDLALNRISRERDAAEAGRLDKEAEVKKLTEQKKMLQMELHALGANVKTGKKGAGEKAEMMCFYCEDRTSNHVRVQFVNARISFADFQDILRRLFDRQGLVTFTYEEGGEERRVRDAETFSRCKEEVENSYSGQGDQAIVIHLDAQRSLGPRESEEQGEGEEELEELEESGGIPDGGGQSRLLEKVGDEGGRKRSFSCKLRCHYEEETIDEVEVDDNTRWIDFLALLRHILKDDATFTYLRRTKEEEKEEEKEEMVQVNNAREFAAFLASLRGSDASMEEIFLVRRESAAFFPSRKESTKRAEIKHGVQDALRQLSSEATSDWPRVDDEERDSHVSEEEELEKEKEEEREREEEAEGGRGGG
mmetsp:Transcript_4873/g.17686  ORF Transcript_4873/g.17686 Transcript_4873/m.17686 type:complete len:788 (-) Transcript_4873:1095-3458(-)